MKFLHSPSPSSSTSEFPTTSCFSAAIRRLLRLHTLRFDHHIQESNGDSAFDELQGSSPGIVAKLMGLDSMPIVDSINKWSQLRLQKKGARFREPPSFVEIENDKFIILSFEGGGKDKELKLKSSKTRNRKNQKMPNCQSQKNGGEVLNTSELLDFNQNSKKSCDTECVKRGRSRNNNLERVKIESDSESSSPVSVLEFPDNQEASNSGKEELTFKNLNSRRKLRGDLDSCNSTDEGDESSRKDKRCVGLKKNNFIIGEMWDEICKLAEKDVMESSMAKRERWKGDDSEEICVNFELQILDQLILELLFTIT